MDIKKKFHWAKGEFRHKVRPLMGTMIHAIIYALVFRAVFVYI